MNREAEAKIESMQDQASKAAGEANARLEKQIGEMKSDSEARSDKLRQAWQLTSQALTTSSALRR